MSEYPHMITYLKEHDPAGTPSLFEASVEAEVGDLQTEARVEKCELQNTYLPETIAVRKNSVRKRHLVRAARLTEALKVEDTPYEDINPNARLMRLESDVPSISAMDTVILEHEGWQKEVTEAIEQLALTTLTQELVSRMTVADRARLGRRVEQLLTMLAHRPKVIRTFGGDVTSHATFYGTYGDRSRDEMLAYANNLDLLKDELLHSPVVYKLLYEAEAVQPNKVRRELCAKKERRRYGDIQVYFDTNPNGVTKPRLANVAEIKLK